MKTLITFIILAVSAYSQDIIWEKNFESAIDLKLSPNQEKILVQENNYEFIIHDINLDESRSYITPDTTVITKIDFFDDERLILITDKNVHLYELGSKTYTDFNYNIKKMDDFFFTKERDILFSRYEFRSDSVKNDKIVISSINLETSDIKSFNLNKLDSVEGIKRAFSIYDINHFRNTDNIIMDLVINIDPESTFLNQERKQLLFDKDFNFIDTIYFDEIDAFGGDHYWNWDEENNILKKFNQNQEILLERSIPLDAYKNELFVSSDEKFAVFHGRSKGFFIYSFNSNRISYSNLDLSIRNPVEYGSLLMFRSDNSIYTIDFVTLSIEKVDQRFSIENSMGKNYKLYDLNGNLLDEGVVSLDFSFVRYVAGLYLIEVDGIVYKIYAI